MRAYLSRRYVLSASHRLYSEAYSEAQNRAVYGKCANPHGHGQVDPVTGMVCDLAALDGCVRTKVIDRFDHTNLNFDQLFAAQVPTTENLCLAIHKLLAADFVHADLERVRVEETQNNFFEYSGKGKHGTASSRS
jgi:6-pyruvoyltetrahydropterin/6-carboxytetrahydropterin synthase